MKTLLLKQLHDEGLISAEVLQQAEELESKRPFSVYWQLRLLLYAGVLLLTSGLGILIYKYIDTIGHAFLIAFIGLVSAGSFLYCQRKKAPFSWEYTAPPNAYFDYVLLLGCLTMLIFLGYLQFQYNVFGDRYGLATFLPMVLLFTVAYYFDHIGALCLAITNLGAWLGVAVTPVNMLKSGSWSDGQLISTGILLGLALLILGYLTGKRRWKAHFESVYSNFGFHLFFIAALSGLFHYENIYFLWFLLQSALAFYFFTRAWKMRSFYFILMIILYSYIALTYVVLRLLFKASLDGLPAAVLYFIASPIGLSILLVHINRKLKAHDRL